MKQIFQSGLALGSLLLSSCVFAVSYNNFYVGANVGYVSLADKEKTTTPISDSHELGAGSIIGGGLIGYDFTLCNRVKLGVEGFANATNVNFSDIQNYAPVASYTVKMRNNYGVRLLPGYELTPGTVGHLIFGYSSGKFEINDNGNYGYVNSQFRRNGFQFGAGMITELCNNFSIRGDVIYTNYTSQTTQGDSTISPLLAAPIPQIYRNDFSTLEGNVELIYKF